MAIDPLALLDDLREESSFLPPIIFGYLYSTTGTDVDGWVQDSLIRYLAPGEDWLLILTFLSLVTGAGVYTIAKTEMKSRKIRNSAGTISGRILDLVVIGDYVFSLIIAPLYLAVRIGNGDLIANTILFIWFALLATTLWSIFLHAMTDIQGFKGFSG